MTADQGAAPADPVLLVPSERPLGHAVLHRPRALNALSLELITALSAVLHRWADDPAVELVLVTGSGDRGLCAGGDIKQLYEGVRTGAGPGSFFRDEYAMNLLIARYPKPYVAVMDGITMGGGVGISGHGSVRVTTERSRIAMPETAIGLFPDVGALHLLSRCPGELGTYLALTGTPLDGPAAVAAGLADRYLPSARIPELVAALAVGRDGLDRFDWPEIPPAAAVPAFIDECFTGSSVLGIVHALQQHPDPAAGRTAELLRTLSPTSLVVTLAALRRAASLDVEQVLAQDLRLTAAFEHVPDLVEGIRAQVIDKDRTPRWSPATLEEVDTAAVERFFG